MGSCPRKGGCHSVVDPMHVLQINIGNNAGTGPFEICFIQRVEGGENEWSSKASLPTPIQCPLQHLKDSGTNPVQQLLHFTGGSAPQGFREVELVQALVSAQTSNCKDSIRRRKS